MGQHRPYIEMVKRAVETLDASSVNDSIKSAAHYAFREVAIKMTGKMTVAAGHAQALIIGGDVIDPVIKLSKFIFGNINDEEKFNVVAHEFAHIVDFYIRGKSDHGIQWMNLHRAMGGTGATTHSYQVKRRAVTRYVMKDTHTGRVVTFKRGSYKNALTWGDRYKLIEVKKIQR